MIRQIPTSVEDFRDIREGDYEYIDKTHLITEIIDRRNYKVIFCRVRGGSARRST